MDESCTISVRVLCFFENENSLKIYTISRKKSTVGIIWPMIVLCNVSYGRCYESDISAILYIRII